MRAVFVDKALREALKAFVETLPEARIAGLSESMLAAGASFLAGGDVALARKGISESAARAVAGRVLSAAASVTFSEDPSIPAPGLVARVSDGSVVLRATMDLVEERLLDQSRGELAKALSAEAFSL